MKSCLNKNRVEVGCDEAGRGCLAGPVYAGAVILPHDFYHPLLNDSKKISKKNRYLLRAIIQKEALDWGVGVVDNHEIDKINILNASFLAMHRAIEKLVYNFDFLIIDGNRFNPYLDIGHECIVKGDSKYAAIAAASILAKTYRDDYMLGLAEIYPDYGWISNKGYPTKAHREGIKKVGTTPFHRMSFSFGKENAK